MEKQERKQEPRREPQGKDDVKANPKVVETGKKLKEDIDKLVDEIDDVLDLLGELVDKSLVTTDEHNGVLRYRLFESIREYAWEKLSGSDEADATCRRREDGLNAVGEQPPPEREGPELSAYLLRLDADAEWNGRRFVVVDTGGLEIDPADPIELRVQEQAQLAIREADAIVFVVDAAIGLTPADEEAAELLRLADAPVLVAVNKADNEKRELEAAEFHQLGWDDTYAISASHGRGVADFLDVLVWRLPTESPEELARKARAAEADAFAAEMNAGRLEPYVVGEADEADEGEPDGGGETADGSAGEAAEAARRRDGELAAAASRKSR